MPIAADQWVRRTNPQMGQVATPVVVSITRKEGQPLVLQKRRWLPLAAEARRRMRRMLLARPITDVVTERDIMGMDSWCFLARRMA